MDSSVRALQSQLDNSNRRTSTAETILRNITQERDSAVSQLGVAYFAIEQLKVENEALKSENHQLKTLLGQLSGDREKETQGRTPKEEVLRRKTQRRTEAVRNMVEETGLQAPELQNKNTTKARHTEGTGKNVESSTPKNAKSMFDLGSNRKDIDELSKGGQRTVQIEDSQDSEDSVYEAPEGKASCRARSSRSVVNGQGEETSQNLTYLSFLEVKNPFMLSL